MVVRVHLRSTTTAALPWLHSAIADNRSHSKPVHFCNESGRLHWRDQRIYQNCELVEGGLEWIARVGADVHCIRQLLDTLQCHSIFVGVSNTVTDCGQTSGPITSDVLEGR